MTAIHEFKCDFCNVRGKARWNSEHWLMPDGWAQIMSEHLQTLDQHICAKCKPKPKLPKKQKGK